MIVSERQRPTAGTIRTHCPYCALQCGLLVTPTADGAVAIAGDAEFPVNAGALCVKGFTAGETLTHPDRLTTPLARNAAGVLTPVTYHYPRFKFEACRVFTNKPACGPKRGHGTPQPRFGQEVQLDKIAVKLGMDPAELRLRNLTKPDSLTASWLKIPPSRWSTSRPPARRSSAAWARCRTWRAMSAR